VAAFFRYWAAGGARRSWAARRGPSPRPAPTGPAVFHVTHWKAGSQWIHKILSRCAGARLVPPGPESADGTFRRPLLPGRVYPTCYLDHGQFHALRLPEPSCRFVVIRDLRDTLVSLYFSVKLSHVAMAEIEPLRAILTRSSFEDGMQYLLEQILPACAGIQRSWIEAGEDVVKYEDLLDRDVEILEPLLTRRCALGVAPERVREAILSCRFERLTGGRARGEEDIRSHERKGVVGDWRNHFTDRLTREFKVRFADVLVATGYEQDDRW
jgi:lipopolysaccharide transport system ATP-binding protein